MTPSPDADERYGPEPVIDHLVIDGRPWWFAFDVDRRRIASALFDDVEDMVRHAAAHDPGGPYAPPRGADALREQARAATSASALAGGPPFSWDTDHAVELAGALRAAADGGTVGAPVPQGLATVLRALPARLGPPPARLHPDLLQLGLPLDDPSAAVTLLDGAADTVELDAVTGRVLDFHLSYASSYALENWRELLGPFVKSNRPRTLQDLAARHDLVDHLDALARAARPAVHYTVHRRGPALGPDPVGGTRLGGRPDLPSGVDWPRDPTGGHRRFLTQVNLAEVPPIPGSPLPERGMLYLFDDDSGTPQPEGAFLVHLGDGPLSPHPDAPDLDQWSEESPARPLVGEVTFNLPSEGTAEGRVLWADIPVQDEETPGDVAIDGGATVDVSLLGCLYVRFAEENGYADWPDEGRVCVLQCQDEVGFRHAVTVPAVDLAAGDWSRWRLEHYES